MYEKVSTHITNLLIKYSFVEKNDLEIYVYCFQIIISTLVSTIFILIWSIIFKQFLNTLFFFTGFFMCRKFSGGYHAQNQLSCFLFTQLIFISFLCWISFSNILKNETILIIISLFSNVIICILAPVDNINNPFSDSEKKKFRKKSLIFALINLILLFITVYFANQIDKFFCYSLGVFAISLMLILGKIKNILLC